MSNELDDAYDDVLAFIKDQADKNDPMYLEFEALYNERNRQIERFVDNMAKAVVELYYYNYDVERMDTRTAWDEAVDIVVRGTVAANMVKLHQVQRDMTDQEIRDANRDISELERTWKKIQRSTNGNRQNARQASIAGRNERDRRDTRSTRDNRSTSRSRIFKDEGDPGGIRDGRGGRMDARARAAQDRLQQYDRPAEREPVRRGSTSRERERNDTSRNNQSDRQYITSMMEIRMHPRRPGQWVMPSYDPATQLLFAYLDEQGFLIFEVKEKDQVDATLHQQAIKHLLSPSRSEDYVRGVNKKAVYQAGGVELDPDQVESEEVQKIMDEYRKAKKIGEKATFMDIPDELRIEILSRAASEINKRRDLQESAKKAALIQSGKIDEYNRSLTVVNVEFPEEISSRKERLSEILTKYGKEINNDVNRTTGYISSYSCLNVMMRCESPEQQQILTNILAGLRKGKGNIQSIAFSLKDKKLPVHLFTRLNLLATQAINMVIHHILGIPAITVDSFVDDIDDLATWFVKQVENGKLTNDKVNQVNHYVQDIIATMVNPSVESIAKHFPRMKEEEVLSLRHQALFSLEKGELVYLPLLAGELGLNMEINEIDLDKASVFRGVYPDAKINSSHGYHYLVTADGLWYQLIGKRENKLILNYVGLDG